MSLQLRYSAEETARRGDEIYEQQVWPQVESGHQGQIVAIDIDSGGYALGDTALAAARSLRVNYPEAEIWLVKIGDKAFHRIGSHKAATLE